MQINPKESFASKIFSNVFKKKEEKNNAWSFICSKVSLSATLPGFFLPLFQYLKSSA